MAGGKFEEFGRERERQNDIVMKYAGQNMKRFYNIDWKVYEDGALPKKTKELLGLVSSTVLRCDDCITYHLVQCKNAGVTDAELEEALAVALVVGGSITIPHIRRAFAAWDEAKRGGGCGCPRGCGGVDYGALEAGIEKILSGKSKREKKLQKICDVLKDGVPYYNWVGFYFVEKPGSKMLVLGPFAGEPTEHKRIPFGRGICGRAAEKKETVVVSDVTKESNYLACSIKVKAEIVVPIFKNGKVVGELDLDSHTADAFTPEDRRFLEKTAESVSEFFTI
jgi:GAF domain-containing protein